MKSDKSIAMDARKELRQYQKYFRQPNNTESWKLEIQRAIYVLREIIGVKWNPETDFYLGTRPKIKR